MLLIDPGVIGTVLLQSWPLALTESAYEACWNHTRCKCMQAIHVLATSDVCAAEGKEAEEVCAQSLQCTLGMN